MTSLSDYQKAVLAELDIPLWQLRCALSAEETDAQVGSFAKAVVESNPEKGPEAQEPEALVDSEHPMAVDMQQHLNAMTGITVHRWVVSSQLSFDDGVLHAPHPMYLATQPETKRRLWELLVD
ncbi:hypothetical protein HMF8227_02049 [Saliniradius amylolyticus]|uniref:Uncharacterized protein n=1 Tax=Saliniradius amylolyticus TaxID=2183582 RepID=A0A2S2E4E7_9ALTE|nr:hypothetical protein [Saliniradius amylolyticus]AWL12514.1 hypothetical protein HMF8227_02049 [Saliniradius amylolyticus]